MKIRNKLKEELLTEGAWYETTSAGNTYYVYLTNSSKYSLDDKLDDLAHNAVMWKNRTHNSLDKKVLDSFVRDVESSGKYSQPVKVSAPAPGTPNILTPNERDFRGKQDAYLHPGVKELISSCSTSDKIYVHHLNSKENDQSADNLVAIPYDKEELPWVNCAHKIMHAAGSDIIKDGTRLTEDIYFYELDPHGTPVQHLIRIDINRI